MLNNEANTGDTLVAERVAQLAAISERRNELLREMYQMIRRRDNAGEGPMLTLNDEAANNTPSILLYLEGFDLVKNPETGVMGNLEIEMIASHPLVQSSIDLGKSNTPPGAFQPAEEPYFGSAEPESHSMALEGLESMQPLALDYASSPSSPPEPNPFDFPTEQVADSPPPQSPLPYSRSRSHSESPEVAEERRVSQVLNYISDGEDIRMDISEDQQSDNEPSESTTSAITTPQAANPDLPFFEPEQVEALVEIPTPELPPIPFATESSEQNTPVKEAVAGEIIPLPSESPVPTAPETAAEETVAADTVPEVIPEEVVTEEIIPAEVAVPIFDASYEPESLTPVEEIIDFNQSADMADAPITPIAYSSPHQTVEIERASTPMVIDDDQVEEPTQLVSPKPIFSPTPSPSLPAVLLDNSSLTIIALAPLSPEPELAQFNFDVELESTAPAEQQQQVPAPSMPDYTLPPLKSLPVEFQRKSKKKSQRKLQKEREKNDRGEGRKDAKDDWASWGMNRWAATIRNNPVHKRVARSTKCISTREWGVAMTEVKLLRTLEQIEVLKEAGLWSFRQPKKQRGVGGLTKTHWDYLMDEMKWMRIDFREERKWKLAIAYDLSTSVLEWHAAGSLAERIALGICVLWKRAPVAKILEEDDLQPDLMEVDLNQQRTEIDDSEVLQQPLKASLLMVDYRSEDDEDEEMDKGKDPVIEPVAPSVLMQDALGTAPKPEEQASQGTQMLIDIKPEDPEFSLTHSNDKDTLNTGLKPTSTDPVLVSDSKTQSNNGDAELVVQNGAKATSSKISLYGPVREQIAFSDNKLFLGPEDFDLGNNEIVDLFTVFPDLSPFGLFDVAPPPSFEGRKKSEKRSDKDDPNKRSEDTTYTKLTLLGKFSTSKPTLLSVLQPAKRWKEDKWVFPEPPVELDGPPSRYPEDASCELFEGKPIATPGPVVHALIPVRKRPSDHLWTSHEDNLLKSLIDRYGSNWGLISECFNASRVTISTDRRSPLDCHERWFTNWGPPNSRNVPSTISDSVSGTPPPPPPSTPSGQMTTRGVKRMASNSVSGSAAPSSGSEPKKRRRHGLMQDIIRRAVKKRENILKTAISNRKTSQIHDTHAQYNRMLKYSPAELSKMKYEKELKDAAEAAAARKRHEEVLRQRAVQSQQAQLAAHQAQQLQQQQQQGQQGGQPQVPPQPQPSPVQLPNGTHRPGPPILPHTQIVPQIRNQVNISQQRISPQQYQQAQARNYVNSHPPGLAAHLAHNGQLVDGTLRAATSSPAQGSSPHRTGTPVSSMNSSPRPPSAQAQIPQVPGNAVPRPTANQGPYYNGNGGNGNNMPQQTPAYTQHMARIQGMQAALQQQQAQTIQAQHAQQQQQNHAQQNGYAS